MELRKNLNFFCKNYKILKNIKIRPKRGSNEKRKKSKKSQKTVILSRPFGWAYALYIYYSTDGYNSEGEEENCAIYAFLSAFA